MSSPWDERSPSEQDRIQGLVLDEWFDAAASFSPYWAQRASRLDIEPRRVDSLEDLRRMPPVRERDIARAGGPGAPELLLRPTEEQVKATAGLSTLWRIARAIRGEGARGKRRGLLAEYKPVHLHRAGRDTDLTVAYSRSDLDRLHRAGARSATVLGLRDTDYLVSAVPRSDRLDFWGVYHLALAASFLAVHGRGSGEGLARAVDAFELVPTTAVAVPVDEAVEFAASVTEADADASRIRRVVTLGPPPPESVRGRIRDAWRAAGATQDLQVLAAWAPPAARALWAECSAGNGLHTFPDMEILEVLDPATGRVSATEGDLTYTSAGWNGTALIRFQTGDHVAGLMRDPCPSCGRTLPRLGSPVTPGIWQPNVRVGSRSRRLDLRGVAAVLAGSDAAPWRLELRKKGAKDRSEGYVLYLPEEPDDREVLDDRLEAAVGLAPMDVLVEDTETLGAAVRDKGVFKDSR